MRPPAFLVTGALVIAAAVPALASQTATIGTGSTTCVAGPHANCAGVKHRFGVEHHGNLHHANFRGANLHHADFSGANLRGADFRSAKLRFVDFSGARLIGAKFHAAPKSGKAGHQTTVAPSCVPACNGADLTSASFAKANLTNANLSGADLTSADLTRANLTGANLSGADLTSADLTDAILTNTDLTGARLTSANLTRARLTSVHVTNADVQGANVTYATISTTMWSGGVTGTPIGALPANWMLVHGWFVGPAAHAAGADLHETAFKDMDFTGIDLSSANLVGTSFKHSTFVNANLSGADMRNGAFEYSNLRGANLSGLVAGRTDVEVLWVYGSDFTGADLTGVDRNRIMGAWGLMPPESTNICPDGHSVPYRLFC